jgi:hypothetical protein
MFPYVPIRTEPIRVNIRYHWHTSRENVQAQTVGGNLKPLTGQIKAGSAISTVEINVPVQGAANLKGRNIKIVDAK